MPSSLPVNRRWTYFDFLVVGALVVFSALRFQVGADYAVYARHSSIADPSSDWGTQIAGSPLEAGYTILSLLAKSATGSPHAIFWITSVLTVVPVYMAIKKQSDDLTLSVLLYVLLAFFVSPFNIIRQGIAISLNFWAFSFLGTNKKAFVAINLVAALFHQTVLLAVLLQLVTLRWKPRLRTILLIVSAAVIVGSQIRSLPFVSQLLTALNPRYEQYLSSGESSGLGAYLLVAAQLGLLLFSLYLGRNDKNSKWITFVMLGVFFLILGTQSVVIARMGAYFGIFLILLLPNQLAERANAVASRFALVLLAAVYFVFYLNNYGQLLPYQTYL